MIYSMKQLTYSLHRTVFNELRRCSSKIAVKVDEEVMKKLENNEIIPRRHPGIMKFNRVELPIRIQKALQKIVGDYPIKRLAEDCQKFNILLTSRHPPPEQNELDNRMMKIMAEVETLMPLENLNTLNEAEQKQWKNRKNEFIRKKMRERTFAWKPIKYGQYESLVYALSRGALEYGVLVRILQEISARDVNFKPQSYIDFGSGVGSGMWAASSVWAESLIEYFNIDCSRFMNELSELILKDGNENQQITLKNVFYRQFLPALETKYNLVISSFTLFELANSKSRLEIIMNLWKKCDGYMVIIEQGTRRGFQLINEVRDFILSQEEQDLVGYVFAPCPHDDTCPRISNIEDRTPCNFEMNYTPTSLNSNASQKIATARYSYVVLKKGIPEDEKRDWPRLVRPTLIRSKHSICRMCTSEGKLEEIIFTQSKHGKPVYRCARASRWGDRLPVVIAKSEDS